MAKREPDFEYCYRISVLVESHTAPQPPKGGVRVEVMKCDNGYSDLNEKNQMNCKVVIGY